MPRRYSEKPVLFIVLIDDTNTKKANNKHLFNCLELQRREDHGGMELEDDEKEGSKPGRQAITTSSGRKDRKVAQRKRTRDLYDKLDPLVPVSATRPAEAEKGSLSSKRTFLQLQDDTIEHLRKLKVERVRRARDGCRPVGLHCGDAPAGDLQPRRRPDPEETTDFMHAMLSSPMLLIEVDVSAWTVVRASAGVRELYRYHPRGDDTLVGECLLHYLDLADTTALRAAVQQQSCGPGQVADAPDILLRTFTHESHMQCCKFRVQRFGSWTQERELLMLHPLAPTRDFLPRLGIEPTRCAHAFGWTMEKMRDMSAIYKYDWSNTTLPPWVLEEQLGHLEAGGGYCQSALARLFSMQTSQDVVHSLVAPQGTSPSIFNTWSTRLKTLLHDMCEMHFTFDAMSETFDRPILTIHIRLRMPGAAGALRTPWVLLDRFALDGSSASSIPGAGKEIRVFAQSCGEDELRLCSLYFRHDHGDKSSLRRACYHTRQWVVDGQCMRISGELFPSAPETPMPFTETFKRVGDADPALISSLLASESFDIANAIAATGADAQRGSGSSWGGFGGLGGLIPPLLGSPASSGLR